MSGPAWRPVPVPVLMYHQIAGRAETPSRLAVPPQALAGQLAWLHDAGFETVTAGRLAQAVAGRAVAGKGEPGAGGAAALPARPVVLTFDDGFEDFHRRALPLLDRYGFTATVFVTSGWVADAGPLPAGRRPGPMLSWAQLGEAAAAGVEIGAHSRFHPQLDQLPPGRLGEELRVSKAELEDGLGAAVPGVAYPYGYSSAAVRQAAAAAGYRYGCAVGNALLGEHPDLFALPRLTIRRSTSLAAFGQAAAGRRIAGAYLGDRLLTRGYALVRRTRAAFALTRNT